LADFVAAEELEEVFGRNFVDEWQYELGEASPAFHREGEVC
jgi:hypothetical protein